MYSAIPVPQVNWEKKTMRWALIFLPFVGVIISTVSWIWFAFCSFFRANSLFYAVGATLIPLCISGGIHLDGLCDTCDALCSFGDREKRLAILKDPHVGAFGPMWICAFLLAECACFSQIFEYSELFPLVLVAFPAARAIGGRKVVASPCAKDSGLAHIFAENSDKRRFIAGNNGIFADFRSASFRRSARYDGSADSDRAPHAVVCLSRKTFKTNFWRDNR